jgi:ribose/xylose/arabinose/galactoside ABC-type transport system permease subunit
MGGAGSSKRIAVIAMLAMNLVIAGVAYALTNGGTIAEAWYAWDANSLVGLQALVEQKIDPDPEDPTWFFDYVLPVLEMPFWLAVLVVIMILDAVPLLLLLRRARN